MKGFIEKNNNNLFKPYLKITLLKSKSLLFEFIRQLLVNKSLIKNAAISLSEKDNFRFGYKQKGKNHLLFFQ